MAIKNISPIRLDESFLPFLEKAQTNRLKVETDMRLIQNPRMSKLIVDYFKLNHDRYMELIKMEEINNG